MEKTFLENEYFNFLNFKILKSDAQKSLSDFCSCYLENYKGTNKDNLESLKLLFNKFLKDNHIDSIFLTIFNNSLKINIYDFKIDFLKINDALESLRTFTKEFKTFLNS